MWEIGKTADNLSFSAPYMENSSHRKLKAGKAFLKWGLMGFFAVILLSAIVLSTLDLNQAKDKLIEKVSAESGMKIEIESVGFGFSHGLGLKCSGVKIATLKGETYAADHLHLVAEWAPLLAGEFKINRAALDGPKLTLKLSDQPEKKPDAEKKEPPDTKPGSTTPAQSVQEALKKSRLSVRNFEISDGQITLIHPAKQKTLIANVDLNLQLNQVSSDRLDMLVDSLKISAGEISLKGKAKGENLTAENGNLSFHLETNSFALEDLKPALAFFSRVNILEKVSSLEIEKFSIRGETPLAAIEKPDSLFERSNGQASFNIKRVSLTGPNPLRIESLEGSGKWSQGVFEPDIKGVALGSEFGLNGKLTTQNINTNIHWKELNITRLPLPASENWSPVSGIVSGKLNLDGPIPQPEKPLPEKLKGKLSFQFKELVLAQPNQPEKISVPKLEGNGDYRNNQLDYQILGGIFDGNFKYKGKVRISKRLNFDSRLEFSDLDLSKANIVKPGIGIPAQGTASGTLKMEGPLPESGGKLPGGLRADTVFDLENISFPVEIEGKTVNAEISKIKGNASLNRNKLDHHITAKLLGGNAAAKGSISLKETGAPQAVDTNLELERLDLAWIQRLKKGDWIPTSGKLAGKLKMKGPLPEDKNSPINLRASGTLTANKLKLGTGEKKNAVETAKLTLKDSSKEFAQVLIELDKFQTAGLRFEKVQSRFKITPKQIDLAEGRVFPENGQLKLAGSFLPPSGAYRLRFRGDKLKIEDFLKQLAGPLSLRGKLNGKVTENPTGFPDIAKELSGQVKINLTDGTLPELESLQTLLTLLNPATALQVKKAGLNYDSLGGAFKITKGVVNTDNFEMTSPQINLQVAGEADLGADTINAQVKAMPLQMLDKTIKAIPLLGNILTGGEEGGVIETYFKVDGKLSAPNVTAQPHKSLTEKPGAILKEIIKIPGNLTKKPR